MNWLGQANYYAESNGTIKDKYSHESHATSDLIKE